MVPRARRVFAQVTRDRLDVAGDERSVEVCAWHARVQGEQPLGAIRASVRGGLDEGTDRGVESERQFFDVRAQRIPRLEAVLARDH
jgi:hypothetical protein